MYYAGIFFKNNNWWDISPPVPMSHQLQVRRYHFNSGVTRYKSARG